MLSSECPGQDIKTYDLSYEEWEKFSCRISEPFAETQYEVPNLICAILIPELTVMDFEEIKSYLTQQRAVEPEQARVIIVNKEDQEQVLL